MSGIEFGIFITYQVDLEDYNGDIKQSFELLVYIVKWQVFSECTDSKHNENNCCNSWTRQR